MPTINYLKKSLTFSKKGHENQFILYKKEIYLFKQVFHFKTFLRVKRFK